MNKVKRLIWCALLFGIQLMYFPLNRYLEGGFEFKTLLDDNIPLWPIWVIPYMLVCVWWVVAHLWAALSMEEDLYETFFIASAVMQVSALMIFIFFPTYVIRTAPASAEGWTAQVLNWVYTNDYAYNAFPSGHVYITTLIALFWSRWYPAWRWLWSATVVIIFLATLFTGQHYLPDPVGGLALAWCSYRVSLWCMTEKNISQPALGHPVESRNH